MPANLKYLSIAVRIFLISKGLPVLVINKEWEGDLGLISKYLATASAADLFKGMVLSFDPSNRGTCKVVGFAKLTSSTRSLANSPILIPVCKRIGKLAKLRVEDVNLANP